MSNRRKLKKYIHRTVMFLYSDCIIYMSYKGADKEKVENLISEISEVYNDTMNKINKAKKDKSGKSVYKGLKSQFKEVIDSIGHKLNKLI